MVASARVDESSAGAPGRTRICDPRLRRETGAPSPAISKHSEERTPARDGGKLAETIEQKTQPVSHGRPWLAVFAELGPDLVRAALALPVGALGPLGVA